MSLRGFATINFSADDLSDAVAWYPEFLGVGPYFERPDYVGVFAASKAD